MSLSFTYRYNRKHEEYLGTLLTLANGRIGIRGEIELAPSNYGLFVSGVYDYTPIFYRELVNFPRINSVVISIDELPLKIEDSSSITRELDMFKGLLNTVVFWRKPEITYRSTRVAHMKYKDLFLQHSVIEFKKNSSNKIKHVEVENIIELDKNNMLEPPEITIKHYRVDKVFIDNGLIALKLSTLDRKYTVSIAVKDVVEPYYDKEVYIRGDNYIRHKMVFHDISRDVDKVYLTRLAVVTSNIVYDDPFEESIKILESLCKKNYSELISEHVLVWKNIWDEISFKLDSVDEAIGEKLLFYAFHLIQLIDENLPYALVPARGLHGLGYRGHVFWDTDIYTLPFYTLLLPKYARKILLYRYYMLDKARENALRNGYRGAQYPWESSDDGEEATPKEIPLDHGWMKKIRIWTGEEEIHITADVAYAVDYYYNLTGDDEFMEKYGLEIIFETTRFWVSRVEYDEEKKAYVIKKVMGPDEYHPHVNNSFYTNLMAHYNIGLGIKYYSKAMAIDNWKRVVEKLGITVEEVSLWKDIVDKIYIPCTNSLCEEFEGYFSLRDHTVDPKKCPGKECIGNLPRNTSIEETRLVKQADVVLAMYLLSNYFDIKTIEENYRYYMKRTTHESSLSLPIYAGVAARIGAIEEGYDLFKKALETDLGDLYGNTSQGIHVATAGGLWFTLLHGFLGVKVIDDKIVLDPRLPSSWRNISLNIWFRGKKYRVAANNKGYAIESI